MDFYKAYINNIIERYGWWSCSLSCLLHRSCKRPKVSHKEEEKFCWNHNLTDSSLCFWWSKVNLALSFTIFSFCLFLFLFVLFILQSKTREEDGLLLHLIFFWLLLYVCATNYMLIFGESKFFDLLASFPLLLYVLERRPRREEVRTKVTNNFALTYSFSICKIYIYYYISNEGNVIHRRRVRKPSLLLVSFLILECILSCVFLTLLQHTLWLFIGVVIFFIGFGCF